ncbi:MAG: ATP-binding cassette domain-containing protein [Deltaproteobacteria bacterium]|jgi:putative ATP-binding cassette transporter|nr:ATP-binding cassette domain-containing protein [Deltaproteobacteria bacterium]
MTQIRFLLYLIKRAGSKRDTLIVTSLLSGIIQGLLLYSINLSVGELSASQSISLRTFLIFVLSICCLYKCLSVAMAISAGIGRDLVTNLELKITENLSQISYRGFFGLNQPKLFEAISGTKDIINEASILLPVFISSITMLLCSVLFSFYVSVVGLVSLSVVMGIAALIFFRSDQKFVAALFKYRLNVDKFQGSLKSVVLGFTELKMNDRKRLELFSREITPLRDKVLIGRQKTDGFRVQNTVMYGLMVYFPVAALLFILPQTGLATFEECIKIVAITMFSTIPLIGLLSFMPMSARAAMIVWSLADFEIELNQLRDETGGQQQKPSDFATIALKDGCFSYKNNINGSHSGNNNGKSGFFTICIKDFYINKGELVILKGGNGSGKSTFMRLLAGLISLDQGRLTLDGSDIEEIGLNNYRAYFSVLFPDFHLFNGLYGISGTLEESRQLLKTMGLDLKVSLDEAGIFSNLTLSSGQRKRLALVCAIMEKRPVLLLDEVAADFDQHFRELFYRTLLPDLKKEGRTILVISHDERYFDVADRVLTLDYGDFV